MTLAINLTYQEVAIIFTAIPVILNTTKQKRKMPHNLNTPTKGNK